MSISCLCVAILYFYLSLASHMMKNSFFECLDLLTNMGAGVGIVHLYCTQAEI